jgi:hypothetical protein
MNATLKTILLTVLTLSFFAIALVELSGVSQTALFNKFGANTEGKEEVKLTPDDKAKRDEEMKAMPKTTMEVPNTKFDFGKMKEGEKVRHNWIVKNTGSNPLMISNVQTSCGCTAPSFPKEPILPGAEAIITLEFNSAGKEGLVNKNALIVANTEDSPFSIGFTAEVEKK